MLTLLCAAAMATVQYRFDPTTHHVYQVQVVFDGFIPMLGGQEGVVDLAMDVAVDGLAKDEEGRDRASSEIKSFKLSFNDAVLPLNVDNVTGYFPKTTVSLSPQGRVVKTDAPDLQLPVRLPGLHVKRFPDITYVPIVFPEEGVEVGKPWSFEKAFGDSNVLYTVVARKMEKGALEMDLTVTQTYTVMEDEAKNVVEDAKDAVARVSTELKGKGTAVFDLEKGAMRSIEIHAEAKSRVVDLQTKEETDRSLKTTLRAKLKGPR